MNLKHEKLALLFGMLLACGARSPMDTPDDQPASSAGGSSGDLGGGGQGGVVGNGGNPSSGGAGGYVPNSGGSGGRTMALGGAIGGGGIVIGGGGGQAGFGPGGSPMGGRGGTAGTSTGGTVVGGRGGTMITGGTMMAGGMMNTGGQITKYDGGAGGTAGTIFRDGGVGGNGGVLGRDGGDLLDVRRIVPEVGDVRPVIADGTTCPGLASYEEMIDDLNDGDRFIPSVNGRAGAWSDSHDSSPGGKMFPDPTTGFVPSDSGDACRKFAAYTSGAGYVLWGANLWVGLGGPYNASNYKGISFWAKIDAGTSAVVRVAFPDKDTQPDGNICQTSVSSGPTACFDHYGFRETLTSTWSKYTIYFSQLSQENWGHAGTAFDPSSLYEILFQIQVGANFGLWIDDIAFTM